MGGRPACCETRSVTLSLDATELVEVSVDRYKNLSGVRLPWSRHVVLFGANGVGKTNILEALALAFGSRATTWQLAARAITPLPGAIATLLRTSDRALPLAPDVVMKSDLRPETSGPFATMLNDCKQFWSLLGVERGRSWTTAMASGALDARVADILAMASNRPLIRYSLERISGLAEAARVSRGDWMREGLDVDPTEITFGRRFSRTLVLDGPPPTWLAGLADRLPAPFAPLRRWLDEAPGVRSPHCDLLELPPADVAPVCVVWLPAERSSDEAWFDLWEAFESARGPAFELRNSLNRLLFRGKDDDEGDPTAQPDADWWLTWHVATTATSVMQRSMPHLRFQPEDAQVVTLEHGGGAISPPLKTGDGFQGLSSGERAWVDVALARSAAGLDQLADEMDWVNAGLAFVSDEELLEAATDLEALLDVFQEEYWSAEDVDRAFLRIIRLLGSADDVVGRWVEGLTGTRRQLMEEAMVDPHGGFRAALMRRLTVEMYDEPERHLHAKAQRVVAEGLASGLDEAHVTLSSHSHLFLGAPGASHFHLSHTPEGPVAATFEPAELDVAAAVTRELGLTRGELLALTDYILIVEGRVDRLVLRAFFAEMLDAGGVRILTLSGVDEAASLAELELIGAALDVPVGILFDHVRLGRVNEHRGDTTKEEDALRALRMQLRRRGKDYDFYGIKREDIVAYLDEAAIAVVAPRFPGWRQLENDRRSNEKFKESLERATGRPVTVRFVEEVIDEMKRLGTRPSAELVDVVASIIASAVVAR